MKTEEALQLHTTREFGVDRDTLFRAWTEEEQLKQWWQPLGRQLTRVENELREGGKVHYEFDGGALQISGNYQEARPGERLVYTWNWQLPEEPVHGGDYLLTVVFSEREGGSRLEVTQDHFASEAAIQPHREGWEEALDRLQDFLEKR